MVLLGGSTGVGGWAGATPLAPISPPIPPSPGLVSVLGDIMLCRGGPSAQPGTGPILMLIVPPVPWQPAFVWGHLERLEEGRGPAPLQDPPCAQVPPCTRDSSCARDPPRAHHGAGFGPSTLHMGMLGEKWLLPSPVPIGDLTCRLPLPG